MIGISATDVAIRRAVRLETLRLVERPSRLGGTYVAIEDDHGLIEVADTRAEAEARVQSCWAQAAHT